MRVVPIWDKSSRPHSILIGPDRWFRCLKCRGCMSSIPQVDVACRCGNVGYDWDAWLYMRDESKVEAIVLDEGERPQAGINWEFPPGSE